MAALLTTIEENMKTLISAMRITDGYNYDWGTSNVVDAAQIEVFPNALIYLVNVDNLDDVDTGAHSQSYHQMATFRIVVRGQVEEEPAIPNFAINPVHNDALDDLLKLFGTNYHIDSSCDVIFFRKAERDNNTSGDVFAASDLVTAWEVYYQQDRLNPLIMG
jgi:hypothetical protein